MTVVSKCVCLCLVVGFLALPVHGDEPFHHTFRYRLGVGTPDGHAMTFSPDGKQLAVAMGYELDFINTRAGEKVGKRKALPVAIGYSKLGDRICLISKTRTEVIDTKTFQKIPFVASVAATANEAARGYLGINLAVKNGKMLVTSVDPKGPCHSFIGVGDELINYGDGKDGRMQSLVGRTVQEVGQITRGGAGTTLRLQILPKGKYSESASQMITIKRKAMKLVTKDGKQQKVFIEEEGKQISNNLLLCHVGERYELRDCSLGRTVARMEKEDIGRRAVANVSNDYSKVVAVGEDRSGILAEVYDVSRERFLTGIPLKSTSCYDVAFAADSNRVLVASWDRIEVLDVAKKESTGFVHVGWKPAVLEGKKRWVKSPVQLIRKLAVSPQGVIATLCPYGNVILWDMETEERLADLPADSREDDDGCEKEMIEFSPDGKVLAYYVGGVLHVVEVTEYHPKRDSDKPVAELTSESK